ncbi:unnamed protein product [Linum tenue]|uniref:Peptidase A1 domain-containing protein n=1 Tax=Linum tenue TaxID=586396 RepID=A0AAV0GU24_9ROSI|nr:unnamed protein product [Linum tenue]
MSGSQWNYRYHPFSLTTPPSHLSMADLVLSNKVVVYDLENQVLGWTDYNCSSSIKIKDEKTGAAYEVSAKDISPAPRLTNPVRQLTFLFLLLSAVLHRFV